MNHLIPEWNFDADIPNSNHKKPVGLVLVYSDDKFVRLSLFCRFSREENELVAELLWQNGPVVLQNQAQRKPQQYEQPTFKSSLSYGNSSSLIQDDETVSWFRSPIEDPFDKDFCSEFSTWLPQSDAVEANKFAKPVADVTSNPHQLTVIPECRENPTFPTKTQTELPLQYKKPGKGVVGESSVMTFGSSHCGSNQLHNDVIDFSRASNGTGTTNGISVEYSFKDDDDDDALKEFSNNEIGKTETIELTSGGSGSSFGRESTGISSHKRKKTDEEESECQSEDVELESAAGTKQTRARPARRSRAAEVHNLSERKRRDRINKKMRALQELIPHCNKTDKASMLDEAIEYLKSLQLQLQMFQVMRMGNEMAAPMMFPGVQQYMSRIAMAMSQSTLLPHHNSMHLSRVPGQNIAMTPLQNQAAICQATRFQNHLQNSVFPEQYARYMSFERLQHPSQAMSMFAYGNPQNAPQTGSASESLPTASASAHGDAATQ